MIVDFTRDQWRTVFESYIRQHSVAEKQYKDECEYIESMKDSARWNEDIEHRFWHHKRMTTAKNKMELCEGIMKALEKAKEAK